MKKIVIFGDSFLAGNELGDEISRPDPDLVWPALIAKRLDVAYDNCAISGCGNDAIARQIYSYYEHNISYNTIAVVQWSYYSRLDYYVQSPHDKWITMDANLCVPQNLSWLDSEKEAIDILEMQKKYFGNNDLWNINKTLQTIFAVQSYLKIKKIPTIQTYVDYNLCHQIGDEYNSTIFGWIRELRKQIKLDLFPGNLTFEDWSHKNGYKVTVPYRHPLHDAHQAAADLWEPVYKKLLDM